MKHGVWGLAVKYFIAFILGVLVIFWLTLGLPDAAFSLAGAYSTEDTLKNLRAELQLDRPAAEQFVTYWQSFLSGSMRGFYTREPLIEVLPIKLFISLGLFAATIAVLIILTAAWLMVFRGTHKFPLIQNLLISGSASVPLFISTIIMLYVCTALGLPLWLGGALALAFFPSLLLSTNIYQRWESLKHKPFHILAVHYRIAPLTLFYRRLREFTPSLSIAFNSMAFFVATGLAVVEWMLGIPGMGRWTLESILRLDIPVIFLTGVIGTFLVCAFLAAEEAINRYFAPMEFD